MSLKRSSSGKFCAVFGCNNSYKKRRLWLNEFCEKEGHENFKHSDCPCLVPFQLHNFPRNECERLRWVEMINRQDYTPSKNSVVCSVHFPDSRPTQENPIPTLSLGYTSHRKLLPRHGQSLCERASLGSEGPLPLSRIQLEDPSYSDSEDNLAPITSDDEDGIDDPLPISAVDNLGSLQTNLRHPLMHEDTESMRRQIDSLRRRCSELEKEAKEKLTLEQNLRMFLTSDQLDHLKGNHKKWSEDTIKKALQIESACGYSGYQTLIQQGYPLPSYKTLFIRSGGTLNVLSEV